MSAGHSGNRHLQLETLLGQRIEHREAEVEQLMELLLRILELLLTVIELPFFISVQRLTEIFAVGTLRRLSCQTAWGPNQGGTDHEQRHGKPRRQALHECSFRAGTHRRHATRGPKIQSEIKTDLSRPAVSMRGGIDGSRAKIPRRNKRLLDDLHRIVGGSKP